MPYIKKRDGDVSKNLFLMNGFSIACSSLGPFHIDKSSSTIALPEIAITDGSLRLATLVLQEDSGVTPSSLCAEVPMSQPLPQPKSAMVSTGTVPVEWDREGVSTKSPKKNIWWTDSTTPEENTKKFTMTTKRVANAETMTDNSWCMVASQSSLNFS